MKKSQHERGWVELWFQPGVVGRCKAAPSCRWRRTKTSTRSQILGRRGAYYMSHSFSESPHSARQGPNFSALFTAFWNWQNITRGGRSGKRGYSLRLFAYTGRFRLGSFNVQFSLFWEILNTDWEQCFPNSGCIGKLSLIDLLDGDRFSQRFFPQTKVSRFPPV